MEFEEMKLVWDSQNNEPLYAINQEALHQRIRAKQGKVNSLLTKFDLIMIFANLFAGSILVFDVVRDGAELYEYAFPIFYFLFVFYGIYRRFAHKQEVKQFAPTILGDLDKAIWQTNYLIDQSRNIFFWYSVPLAVVFSLIMVLNGRWLWALLFTAVFLPLSYYGGRWESGRWYEPKLRELKKLRQTLTEAETASS